MGKWVLVNRAKPGCASGVAMARLKRALVDKGIMYDERLSWSASLPAKILIAAKNTDAAAANLLGHIETAPESLQFACPGNARVVSGSDERGLSYALMELAERVEAYGEAALTNLREETHSPANHIRGIDRLISHSGDGDWWMNQAYWRTYLEAMLANRYNRLTLLVGFDTGYLTPPYPFFVDVPNFPNVKLTRDDLSRPAHLAALRNLGKLCHEYGMTFVFATWQQAPWQTEQQSLVTGITDLAAYAKAGIRELVLACPEIDIIHFRVNHEAGVGTQLTVEDFWKNMIDGLYEARQSGSRVELELRAKGLTDHMIAYAKDLGFDLTVSTKYWCEHAGLPYHLTRMRTEELLKLENLNASRRYSYADMLKKPRLHRFFYRLWNYGSTGLFTWGDPNYVQRFMASLKLGNADGFEIMPPLSLKGGPEHDKYTGWHIFDDAALRMAGYEDERYWLFNRLFGRIGYNPAEPSEVWLRPMRQRFAAAAEAMAGCIAAASMVVPYIIGFHMPVHPQVWYWPEFSTGGALFPENNHTHALKAVGITYQDTEPGDAGLFYPVVDYVKDVLKKKTDGRYTPYQVAAQLGLFAKLITQRLAEVEVAGLPDTPEAKGARLDVLMLRDLALYHRYKIIAAVQYCFYQENGDMAALPASAALIKKARTHFSAMALLGEAYHKKLSFYVGYNTNNRKGHWKDFLPELDADIKRLSALPGSAQKASPEIPPAPITPLLWSDNVPPACPHGEALQITLKTGFLEALSGPVRLRYRHTNQLEGHFISIEMKQAEGSYEAEIPASYITPEWDLLIYFQATAPDGSGLIFPGLSHPNHALPYHLVTVI